MAFRSRRERNAAPPRVLRSILALSVFTTLLVFALDAAIFRTGIYVDVLEPNSYAGQFLAAVRNVHSVPAGSAKPILILGDSRINEGFSAKIADGLRGGVHFVSAAVPGASLRAFYYVLREADSERDGFSAIVLPVDDYDDEDGPYDRDDIVEDIRLIIPALRLTDVPEFAGSYRRWDARCEIFRKAVFKGLTYSDDVRALLRDPAARVASAEAFEAHGSQWRYDYGGNPNNLDGLGWNSTTRTLEIPPGIVPEIQTQLKQVYSRGPSPQTGRYKRYRKYWFNRLIEPYEQGNTKIIVVRLPRNPLPAPHYAVYDPESAVRALRSHPAVKVEDEHTFEYLEKPGYFADALHMNSAGRSIFSTALAQLALTEIRNR